MSAATATTPAAAPKRAALWPGLRAALRLSPATAYVLRTLLAMGIACGYLGAAPSLLWAVSAMTLVFAPFLILVSIWIYTLVFAFSSLWFAHYLLAALQRLRGESDGLPAAPATLPDGSAAAPANPDVSNPPWRSSPA